MSEKTDHLYELLPAVYRLRDAEQGYPLQALLRVIDEQVAVVREDIDQLYENWFVETAQDWAVPYIGDLVGYQPVFEAGEPGSATTAQGQARNKILIPRRDVANTLRNRRRKGTLALLELLASDVAGWPARAVEFYKLLGWTQNLNHQHARRGQTVDLRKGEALDLLDGPFDRVAHTVDVHRVASGRTPGRHNIPSVGLFVWRLKPYSVTETPAYCLEEVGPHCYTFSVLGQDTALHIQPQPESEPSQIAGELNLPAPIRRRAFEQRMADFYDAAQSLVIWAGDWANLDPKKPVPSSSIIAADLTDWQYAPPRNRIAVDPLRGRIAFPPSQLPKRKVRVSYRYAFSADIGGGQYDRTLIEPPSATTYKVGEGQDNKRLADALKRWRTEDPDDAVIELCDSAVYVEQIAITLRPGQSLQVRAANRCRPVLRLLDWNTDLQDALSITLAQDSCLTLDGLLITGRSVHIQGAAHEDASGASNSLCAAEVAIRHCTLVPGWGLHNDCQPRRPAEPSLELSNVRARLRIEHSIVGSIQINEDEVTTDPMPLIISDSIVDATGAEREAIGAPGYAAAHSVLTIQRCTVFGIVQVHAIELAENCIFMHCVHVARRQLGCMRFCYVPPGCRTPRRYHCQPDLAAVDLVGADKARADLRVRPQLNSSAYGTATYCQLADTCAEEITRGADDESEMGAFHDLFQPQRAANLRARLAEYVPAGMEAAIIFAS